MNKLTEYDRLNFELTTCKNMIHMWKQGSGAFRENALFYWEFRKEKAEESIEKYFENHSGNPESEAGRAIIKDAKAIASRVKENLIAHKRFVSLFF